MLKDVLSFRDNVFTQTERKACFNICIVVFYSNLFMCLNLKCYIQLTHMIYGVLAVFGSLREIP